MKKALVTLSFLTLIVTTQQSAFASPRHAGLGDALGNVFNHIGHTVKKKANELKNTVQREANNFKHTVQREANKFENTLKRAGQSVLQAGADAVVKAGVKVAQQAVAQNAQTIQTQVQAVSDQASTVATSLLAQANQSVDQVLGKVKVAARNAAITLVVAIISAVSSWFAITKWFA
ncbi:MAG: hypothetical protein NKF37_03195 [Tropheryma whipplei]|uniref:Secreted protein n=1 Tax=Tropheryma whipplei (strain Twist) TaxID=203267 RepID=Q81ZR1_TROWT|nr:hypothetical protein [Tropheryma whipplei]AAO44250.1 unknown [Tropheryma whipplei str. Twist]AAO44403.1 unknown [Tropheryma whipplei str. Twist]MCO8190203.1 hypothetical protein [Tropheryma whipplei]MCO8190527.1 hypothetical protein [Tropheryma whipplei]CAD67134.1 putative membrane protein [Tropheryma whipplei TW08/27]